MEDQQSAAGDLTDSDGDHDARNSAVVGTERQMPVGKKRRTQVPAEDAPAEDAPAGDAPAAKAPADEVAADKAADVADTAAADADENGSAPTDSPVAEETVGTPVIFSDRKVAGRWAPAVLGVAVALLIGAGAFAGAAVQPYLADRAAVDTRLDIARTAAEAITTLWTYTPENMESLADRSARYLGGDFEAQYRKYVDAIAPTNKQAQVSNNTQVVGAAVESLNGADATAIVYTNSTATSPLTKDIPSLRYLSYRLTLQRDDGSTWLVTSMNTITSLDLTPQI